MKKNHYGNSFKLRSFTLLVMALLFGLFVSSCGAGEEEPYRVGILAGLGDLLAPIEESFKADMADLGYIEGENIIYDRQATDFDIAAYQSIAQQFVADEVDLIFVYPTEAVIEAQNAVAGTDIPVLFTFASVQGLGIIDSVQTPGNNTTGVRFPAIDIAVLRYEMLHDILPDMDQLLVPYQDGLPIMQPQLEALRPIAEADGVTLIELPATNPGEIAAYLQEHGAAGDLDDVDAILMMVDSLSSLPPSYSVLVEFARPRNLPIAGTYVELGTEDPADDYPTIFGVNIDGPTSGELAAPLADKILQGTDAGTIPVVSPEPFIEIDYKMIQALGLEIPDSLLARADEVYR